MLQIEDPLDLEELQQKIPELLLLTRLLVRTVRPYAMRTEVFLLKVWFLVMTSLWKTNFSLQDILRQFDQGMLLEQ